MWNLKLNVEKNKVMVADRENIALKVGNRINMDTPN